MYRSFALFSLYTVYPLCSSNVILNTSMARVHYILREHISFWTIGPKVDSSHCAIQVSWSQAESPEPALNSLWSVEAPWRKQASEPPLLRRARLSPGNGEEWPLVGSESLSCAIYGMISIKTTSLFFPGIQLPCGTPQSIVFLISKPTVGQVL